VVVIWGDDQYENFKEDIIPPFCVLAYESIEHRPWAVPGCRTCGTSRRMRPSRTRATAPRRRSSPRADEGFDVSYAYRPLHRPLAFMNTLLFLDYDRRGFPYPVVPFPVNCYGRRVIAQRVREVPGRDGTRDQGEAGAG
jgi:hypothetical protein